MEATVESLCTALVKSRLVMPDAARALYQRWLREAKESAPDLKKFSLWLVQNQVASEYQIGVLSRGRGDQLYLNQYKIVDRVGRGRMAGVFKAVHNLGQAVAIKVLPPSKARDAAIFARFQREARLALRLKHPNIVRTFQTGDADGLYYLVMEYLEGETLAEVLARRRCLSAPEAIRVVYQALLGLQHLHEQGFVHRDMTPGNLMLIDAEPESVLSATVKILDIGTGRELFDEGSSGETEFALTNEGDVLGTPLYMAPEQASDPHGADVRADIYSLGCVLYHALAGRPPFDDKSSVRLLMRHATEAPPPLADVCTQSLPGLQGVLDRMLAKERGKRFATPREALLALQPFLTVAVPDNFGPAEPRFRAYLQWLDAQGSVTATDLEAEASVPPPPLSTTSRPGSKPAFQPVPEPPPPTIREDAIGKRLRNPTSAPGERPAPTASARKPAIKTLVQPRRAVGPADVDVEPVRMVPARTDATIAEVLPVDLAENQPGEGLNSRHLLMVGIGVGVVCIVLLAVVIVLLLLH